MASLIPTNHNTSSQTMTYNAKTNKVKAKPMISPKINERVPKTKKI